MTSIDEGMQIDESNEQRQNADLSICESLEFDSNLTHESSSHGEKQFSPMSSTDEGMQIDESDEQHEKADFSTCESLDFDSNITQERLVQVKKQ
jgi:hypothetical protein